LGVRFEFASRGVEDVLLEKPWPEGSPRPTGPIREVVKNRMRVFDRFQPTKTARFPAAYLIPAAEAKTAELLRSHGIVVERLLEAWRGPADQFTVSAMVQAERPFQGKRLITLNGEFRSTSASAAPGAFLVRTAQPLGILAFHMLEPESQDGAAAWGIMGNSFPTGTAYPILKCFAPVTAATTTATP
jgi:hypothetical protein